MESVFIVSSSQQAADLLSGLLGTAGYRQTAYAKSGAEARRMLIDNDFGLILVNTPLTDEFGHELAISVSQMTTAGVMLLVKNENADEVSARVEDYGVLVVAKPVIRRATGSWVCRAKTSDCRARLKRSAWSTARSARSSNTSI